MSADIAREAEARHDKAQESNEPAEVQHKTFWQAALPVFACGAGLFSDGYINNVSTGKFAPGKNHMLTALTRSLGR